MGQVLAIGIVIKYETSKRNLQKNNITKEELIDEMMAKKHFDPTIYDFSETDESYLFTLKASVLADQFIHFLEKFYPLVYLGRNKEFEDTLEMLKQAEPSTWIDLSEKKSAEEFQMDEYGEPEYLYFDKPFKPYAIIASTAIMLSHEGKISMEIYGRQFNFFKYCIQETFSEFSIAKALRVYISG
jgi:hypothetical protein